MPISIRLPWRYCSDWTKYSNVPTSMCLPCRQGASLLYLNITSRVLLWKLRWSDESFLSQWSFCKGQESKYIRLFSLTIHFYLQYTTLAYPVMTWATIAKGKWLQDMIASTKQFLLEKIHENTGKRQKEKETVISYNI